MNRRRVIAGALLLGVSLVGCSGDDEPDPSAGPSAGASASPSPGESTAERLTEEILAGDPAPSPATSVAGGLVAVNNSGTIPVEVDILSVEASAGSTLLRWRLRSGTGQPVQTYTPSLARSLLFDTRRVALVDSANNQRWQPFTFVPQGGSDDNGCVCSRMPDEVTDNGALMYALFPPLDPSATTVDVAIPGLPDAERVPVTR